MKIRRFFWDKRIKLRTVSLCLIAALCLYNAPVMVAKADVLSDAQAKLDELQAALKNAQSTVNNLSKSKKDAESKVKELNKQLDSIAKEASDLESQLLGLQTKITESEEDLEEAEAIEEEQYESMKKRIKFLYENGRSNELNMLFTADNFGSFLNAVEYVEMMEGYDRAQLAEYAAPHLSVQEKKDFLEACYDKVAAMKREIKAEQATMSKLLSAKDAELAIINEDLTEAEKLQREYEAEVKAQNEVLAAARAAMAGAGGFSEVSVNASGFIWPCPSSHRITSNYGPRTSPTSGASTNHKGIDIGAPAGSAIVAAQGGTVITATYSSSAGNYVIIDHGYNANGVLIYSIYMHASALYVSAGQSVSQGQTIAAVGSTGVSTGNHLHFGVMENGSYVNPLGYVN